MRRIVSIIAVSVLTVAIASPSATAAETTPSDVASVVNCTTAVDGTVTLTSDVGTGNRQLNVGCHLTVDLAGFTLHTSQIVIDTNMSLTIDDSGTGGKLIADGQPMGGASIEVRLGAALTVNDGAITSIGGLNSAGIGGSAFVSGTITINGGHVTATGGPHAAGIGSGSRANSGTVTINGGTVIATGGFRGAGIGSGSEGGRGTTIINGGTVTATGGEGAAGIGSGRQAHSDTVVTITGGTVTATGHDDGAGIGGGRDGDGGTTTITGGIVDAHGGLRAAGIGGGYGGGGGNITINDGTVTAEGGEHGAGIGGGGDSDGGTTTITGGTVTAKSSLSGAGVGGGNRGNGGTTTITGGSITTAGGASGAGIGSGAFADGGDVTIEGGTVTAEGGKWGAGIGGGDYGSGGTITVTDGTITATGGEGAAGIGGGLRGDGGIATTISGGTVTSAGGDYGVGMGGGFAGAGGEVAIDDGAYVVAVAGTEGFALGSGDGAGQFGSLSLSGTLHVPAGELRVPDSDTSGPEIVITETGQLLGTEVDPTQGATITGTGQIDNRGVIALNADLVDVTITTHDYLVDFDTQGGTDPDSIRVFANNFAVGYRNLPAAPTDTAWNLAADGSGTWLSDSTELTANTTVFATSNIEVAITPSATSVKQGDTLTFEITGTDHLGNPVNTDDAVLTSSVTTDIIDGLSVTFPEASPHTITATLGLATASVTIDVIPTPLPAQPSPDPTPPTLPPPGGDPQDNQLANTGTHSNTGPLALAALLLVAIGLITRRLTPRGRR